MRVLVEQTESTLRSAIDRLGVLWDGSSSHREKVGVHVLMGGADPGGDWHLFPDECAVFVGTQDMLLSRALNRGYASGRARWPLEFGLLSHDALWVMDEVQLMDVGLATSAQLQAYHDDDALRGHGSRRYTWWMSATLQPSWLESVDTTRHHPSWVRDTVVVASNARSGDAWQIRKSGSIGALGTRDARKFAEEALDVHGKLADGEYGRVTLVVCNTVKRACETFDQLRRLAPAQAVELVHGRFRPAERAAWRERFLNREACCEGVDRIIVATQVVEAGVDISAGALVTEIAPWPSLVQRFGRCARYSGTGTIRVIDRGRDDASAAPYEPSALDAAWDALLKLLEAREGDVGIASLEIFEDNLDDTTRASLYPYTPACLLLRRELEELFDTTPDLSGADLDVSRFIRTGEERDVLVFWREGPPMDNPARIELCPVSFLVAQSWLCGEQTKSVRNPRLRKRMRAWVWDWLDGQWKIAERASITPGRVICVAADCGGYSLERGFDPDNDSAVPVLMPRVLSLQSEQEARADASEEAEDLSVASWKTIATHGAEVEAEAACIADAVRLDADLRKILLLAGRWHDFGKAHPAFQGKIRRADRPARLDLAKAPPDAWRKSSQTLDDQDTRPGLRHELASALALFSVLERHRPDHPALLGPWTEMLRLAGRDVRTVASGTAPSATEQAVLNCSAEEFDLLVYLVACHHGKVRVALHAGPKDQDYRDHDGRGLPIRGVREGDTLPSTAIDESANAIPALTLTLSPASLGLSSRTGRTWRERTMDLLARFGPGKLAWLEALIIAADRRASRLTTPDPLLTGESQS